MFAIHNMMISSGPNISKRMGTFSPLALMCPIVGVHLNSVVVMLPIAEAFSHPVVFNSTIVK